MRVSYLALQNEVIHDLLQPHQGVKHSIVEHPIQGPFVSGLHEEVVTTVEELDVVLAIGQKHRAAFPRSHVMFCAAVESMPNLVEAGAICPGNAIEANTSPVYLSAVRRGLLKFLDLTGSESWQKSRPSNSLGALRQVIATLAANSAEAHEGKAVKQVPYQRSVLTRLLQAALGGNARTCMLVTISSSPKAREDMRLSLKCALQAKNIKNNPAVLVMDKKESMLSALKNEITTLKEQLATEERQSSTVAELTEGNKAAASEMQHARAQAAQMQALLQMTVSASKAAQKAGEYAALHKLRQNMNAAAIGRRRIQSVRCC